MVAAKSAKRHVLSAIDALSELFIESLLPHTSKLKTLQQQDWQLMHRLERKESEDRKGGEKKGGEKGVESKKGESLGGNRAGSDCGQLLLMWRYEECLKEQ